MDSPDPVLVAAFQDLERAERAAREVLADRLHAIRAALTAVWGEDAVRSATPLREHCRRLRVFVDHNCSLMVELDGPAGVATVTLIEHAHWHWNRWGPCVLDLGAL